ncbi:MAG TPA: cupin domain-containing protein [Thermoanaerobaculia bacterium]|nr:cupin domain-containing protein [Thermoanaerobaculia bacterium]
MTESSPFEHLIAPVAPERFFRDHWERAPLVVAAAEAGRGADHYADLLTLADLDRLLAEGGLQHPGLRLVRDGKALPRGRFTEDVAWGDGVFRGAIVVERVLAEHRAGATVVFQALHRSYRPLALLCRDLERRFAHRFQANVYLTPPGERGLGIHFDRHDVFVLQVHGSKNWTIWDAALDLPSRSHRFDARATDPGEPIHRVTLRSGDLLYLPRGYPHRAEARDEPSVHVALGVVTTTWVDVFAKALTGLAEDPAFRRSLPAGTLADPAGWSTLEDDFRALCRRFADTAELAPILDRLAARFAETRTPLATGRLAAASEPVEVDADTLLVRSREVVAYLVQQGGDGGAGGRAELVLPGRRVTFPAEARPALERMQTGEPFRVGDLPGGIDGESREVIARRLVVEGYLVPADAGVGDEEQRRVRDPALASFGSVRGGFAGRTSAERADAGPP